MELSFENAYNEMKSRCPLITNLLTTIACAKNITAASQRASINSISMAAAILFRNNSRRMTAFQLFLTLILNHSSYTVNIAKTQSSKHLGLSENGYCARCKFQDWESNPDFLCTQEYLNGIS